MMQSLKLVLSEFKNKRVLVIGDYYLDEYISGVSDKISPEAPVLRMTVREKEHIPGAAANVAVGFAAMGAQVFAGGIIGNDNYGEILRNKLLEKRVSTQGLFPSMERKTGVLSRILLEAAGNAKQHVIRFDTENTQVPSPDFYAKFKQFLSEKLEEVDLLYVADYDEAPEKSGLVTGELLAFCLEQARMKNVMTVGISRLNIHSFKQFDVLFMNQKEAETAAEKTARTNEEFLALSKQLHMLFDNKITVLTRGKEGLVVMKDEEIISLPSFAKTVVDVCGAGDSLSIGFSLALLSGANLHEAATIGNAAASVAISKSGTATVDCEEIADLLSAKDSTTHHKIKTTQDLLKTVQHMRKQKKKMVFTNGYFDLFHAGHVQLLERAKEKGDVLIVGLNSDRSVRENKGFGRPILPESERLKILSGLQYVDYVTVFDELTPIRLISLLKPDVLVKGGNYTKEEVVGKDIVESYGGIVELIQITSETNAEKMIDAITAAKAHHENVQ